jgi:hypothetical protein
MQHRLPPRIAPLSYSVPEVWNIFVALSTHGHQKGEYHRLLIVMTKKRRNVKLALLPWMATFSAPVLATVAVTSPGEQHDDESRVFTLGRHSAKPPTAKSSNYILRMPDHVVKFSKMAKAMNVDASFLDAVAEEESRAVKTIPTNTNNRRSRASLLPRSNPLLNSGLAALALVSFAASDHGLKAFKELAVGAVSALALVWVPTLLVSGGWTEFLTGAIFVTHPTSRRFLVRKLIPKTFSTLKKLFLTELWRTVWSILLAPLPKPLLAPSDRNVLRLQGLPDYVKEGLLYFRDKVDSFVLSIFKGSVQKSVHGTLGIFFDSVSSTIMEVSLYEESIDGSNDLMEKPDEEEGDLSDDDSDGDESHEPQVVCDGDVCWLE